MQRKAILQISVSLFVAVGLLGCINNKEKITFYADGTADIEAIVEISDGDVGDEEGRSGWRVWIWMYRYMFPELRENYTLTEEFVSETQRLRFIFKNRRRFKIQNTDLLSFTQQSNGAFTFSSTIPKFSPNGEESDEANSEVIFELTVEMPKEIERSNATSIDGKAAKWAITWEDLTKELTLKAVTKN